MWSLRAHWNHAKVDSAYLINKELEEDKSNNLTVAVSTDWAWSWNWTWVSEFSMLYWCCNPAPQEKAYIKVGSSVDFRVRVTESES